jgi:hypothetical protein
MTSFARPRVVLSRCLELDRVRYDGEKIAYGFVLELERHVDLVPICPEVEIGLGVPRDPIRLVEGETGHLAVADEGKLRDARVREHFLTKLFALASLRELEEAGSLRDLIDFQARYELVLMAYSRKGLSGLGRLLAEGRARPFTELLAEYRTEFGALLRQPPGHASVITVSDRAATFPEALMSVSDSRKDRQL